jgi:hypothetical protein
MIGVYAVDAGTAEGAVAAEEVPHGRSPPAHPMHLIPPSALSRKVTSEPLFSVLSGRTQVSGVDICLLQLSHCSGSCLMGPC